MSQQFLERHRGASTKACGGCVWFWFECTQLLPPSEFSAPEPATESQTRLFSFSGLIFFASSLLVLPQSPSGGSSLRCVWGLGLWDAGCLPWLLHARGKESLEQGLGWLATALKFTKQGCSHHICRNGKAPLVQVKQSPLENGPEVTIFTPSYWKGFLPSTPLCVSKVLISVL